MSSYVGVLAFIVALVVMVMIHESGHYVTARAFGMKIEEFFFGFGPRLVSWRRGETEYGIKAIPAGGYVKIAGMNPLQSVPEEELSRTFGAKPAWQRAIVLVAGSATHFILAGLLLVASFSLLGTIGNPSTTLDSVSASPTARTGVKGPAEEAGLQPGDRIVAADGTHISSWTKVQSIIQHHPGVPVSLKIDRSGKLLPFTVVPESRPNPDPTAALKTVGFIGVSPRMIENRQSLPKALWSATREVGTLIVASVTGVGALFSPHGVGQIVSALGKPNASSTASSSAGASASGAQPVGLVGGARLAGQAVQAGQGQALLNLLAAFIVFLGVLNLVPLPPLDGGHLLLLAIAKVRRRPVDMRKVVPVAAFVLSVFVVLSVVVLYLDIVHPMVNPFN